MIRINLDVMLARRKMSLTELSERVGVTMANLSVLKTGKGRALYNPRSALPGAGLPAGGYIGVCER